MNVTSISRPPVRRNLGKAVLLAGLAAGVVDAVYFSAKAVIEGGTPIGALQAIAGFWPGGTAGGGGPPSALLGAATHFGLATIMAAGFVVFAPRSLRSMALRSGATYGVFLYLVMYLIVLPLRWPQIFPRWDGWVSTLDIFIHVAVGITIAEVAAREARAK